MDKTLLINLIRENPPLWDQRDKEYHNRDLRGLLWGEIAENMGVSAAQAKKQWELLRDTFRREIKKVETDRSDKWPYFENMLFLQTARKKAKNIPPVSSPNYSPSPSRFPKTEINLDNRFLQDLVEENSETSNERYKVKRNSFQNEEIDIEAKKMKLFEQEFQLQIQEDDEDLHFFKSILPHVRKLSDIQKINVRMEFMGIIRRELESTRQGTSQNHTNTDPLSMSTPASSSREETQSSCPIINTGPDEWLQSDSPTS